MYHARFAPTLAQALEKAQLPPLHAVDPKEIFCARATSLVLPVEGAPLVFATSYAHAMHLTLSAKDGTSIDLPARADASQGGFVIDTADLGGVTLGPHGIWVGGVLGAASLVF